MGILFIAFLVILAVPAGVAFAISAGVAEHLTNTGNKRVKMIRTLTFIGCFLILLAGVLYGLSFIRLER